MNNMVFATGGDWDTTTLQNNGVEVLAAQMFVELAAGRNDYGEPANGGVGLGGTITATVRLQEDPNNAIGIFPGRLEMSFPGHTLVIENTHPAFAFEFTRVWHNGADVTNQIVDAYVDIDAINNNVKAYLTLYKHHFLAASEVATYNIIG